MTSVGMPRTRREAKALYIIRAMFKAKPGREQRAARKAEKRFKARHPKGSDSWRTISKKLK